MLLSSKLYKYVIIFQITNDCHAFTVALILYVSFELEIISLGIGVELLHDITSVG